MIGDREKGIDALDSYYFSGGASNLLEFDELISFYDKKSPSFIGNFGAAIRQSGMSEDSVHNAMLTLAANTPMGKLPQHTSFFDALYDASRPTFIDYVKLAGESLVVGVKQTGQLAAGVAVGGLAIYGLWIVGGFFVLAYLQKKGMRAA